MGQSAPTVTDAFQTFQSRYAAFRAELEPREQEWFDELVCAARRHSNAINRRPHLDFERPVMLAMLLESMRHLDESEARTRRMHEAGEFFAHAGRWVVGGLYLLVMLAWYLRPLLRKPKPAAA